MRILSIVLILFTFLVYSCSEQGGADDYSSTEANMASLEDNPFTKASPLPYKMPPFDKIEESHYAPAFEYGMAKHAEEIEAIAQSAEEPTFENTLIAMEQSGQILSRVSRVFFGLVSANTNDALDSINTEMAPKLSAHWDNIYLNATLFERVARLYEEKDQLDLMKRPGISSINIILILFGLVRNFPMRTRKA